MRTPELAAMSNGLHLLLAGLLSRCYSLHVPGLANPTDIPSRVPFIAVGGSWVLDRLWPTSATLAPLSHLELQGSGKGEIDLATRKDTFPGSRRLASLRLFISGGGRIRRCAQQPLLL